MKKTKRSKFIFLLLAVLMLVGSIPLSAFAASEKGILTEKYVNEATGKEIIDSKTSTVASDAKKPQSIAGYLYEEYTEETEYIYSKEDLTYLYGYPDKTVQGEKQLSRAEAAAIFYRLYDGEYPKFINRMNGKTFSDVNTKAWYYTEVETLYNIGIISGYSDGTFKPNSPVTRAELAKMVAAFDELEYSEDKMFTDVTKDHWAFSFINAAAIAGWVQGYGDGTFRPDRNISRSETVTLVNRMINRVITVDELRKLGVNNPYEDLAETYWGYADLIEATVKHSSSDWHSTDYKDGKFNLVIEHFVDSEGNKIAEDVISDGKELTSAKPIDKYSYLGYITEITYTYSKGKSAPAIKKTADKSSAKVGDSITYTIKVLNDKTATCNLENAIVTDKMSEFLDFTHGSVQIDKKTAPYSFDEDSKVLSIELGSIEPKQEKTITFTAVIKANAYGEVIKNTAVLKSNNGEEVKDTDKGVDVADGDTIPSITKENNMEKAQVGDIVTYTIKVKNGDKATVDMENVVVSDEISEYLNFAFGSVQIDGKSAEYSYDTDKRVLSVELNSIAPKKTKTVTFSAAVNSTAYGKSFINTAVASSENGKRVTAMDKGCTVANGTPEGFAGAKTVSHSSAQVGDTLTYSITLRNLASATSEWKDITIKDMIPEHLSFLYGSVEEDGKSTTNFSYDTESRTLSLFADNVGIGKSKTFTFKVSVDDGAQGLYIVNTAVVNSKDDDMQLPDTGVLIEKGQTIPSITKSSSVKEAMEGDIYSYTVSLKNGSKATAAWKNVIFSDVLPTGLKLVSGSVSLNNESVSYGISGQAFEVTVGDLLAGEEATVRFEVKVLESAVGTTVTNVAVAKGDNGEKTGTDEGVKVPTPPTEEDEMLTGSKEVDKTVVEAGKNVKFTITAKNNTDEVWKDAYIYDVLDTSMVTLITDTIYVDGIQFLQSSDKWTYSNKQLVIYLGDVAPQQEVICDFSVRMKSDAAGSVYVNNAVIKGTDGKTVYVKSPEISILGGESGGGTITATELHYRIFAGIADYTGTPLYLWKPNDPIDIAHMCIAGYRMMTDYYRGTLGYGNIPVPPEIRTREVQFMISHGVITADEYQGSTPATQSQITRILNFSIGADLKDLGSTATMKRHEVARLICEVTNRDMKPNKSGFPVSYFTDKGAFVDLIDEVSNTHDYTIDSRGKETWVSVVND